MMLVAEYVKFFSRIGTQPFRFVRYVGAHIELQLQRSVSNLQPTVVAATSEHAISPITIYLAA
jgi:hypothetical protein